MIRHKWKIACTGMLFLGLWFGSCNNDDFSVGKYLLIPHTTAGMIDTVTIRVTNLVAADSVVTSGKEIGFSGTYNDPQIGTFHAQTYIEFARTTDSEPDRYAKFDSVTLVLRSNGYYYGDTLAHAAFRVFGLVKPIEKRDDGYLYSTSTVPVGVQYVDTAFKVRVKDNLQYKKISWDSTDDEKKEDERLKKMCEIEIKLPRSFGERLFQGILRDDDAFKTENFLKTFPGLSIAAGMESACVHGLNLNGDSACMIRIYYHVSTAYKEGKTMNFKANPNSTFYRLWGEKEKLPVYNMKSNPVPSAQTGNRGIIMSGSSPMYARLEFPHLNDLLWLGHSKIVKIQKATLYVRHPSFIRHSAVTPQFEHFLFRPHKQYSAE